MLRCYYVNMNNQYNNFNNWDGDSNKIRDPFGQGNHPNYSYGTPPPVTKKPPPTAFGTVSLVVGILSTVFSLLFFGAFMIFYSVSNYSVLHFILAMVFSSLTGALETLHILGLVFGIIQSSFNKKRNVQSGKPALCITLSVISIILSVIFIIVMVILGIFSLVQYVI